MKLALILKTALNICYILLAIGILAKFVLFIFALVFDNFIIPIHINEEQVKSFNFGNTAMVIVNFAFSILFLSIVHYLKKLADSFLEKEQFGPSQSQYLQRTGILILIISFSNAILKPFFAFLFLPDASLRVSLGGDNFESFWFTLGLGLFFLYLAKLFQHARHLREENELTV